MVPAHDATLGVRDDHGVRELVDQPCKQRGRQLDRAVDPSSEARRFAAGVGVGAAAGVGTREGLARSSREPSTRRRS
jgi:hypothetical protein